MPANLENSAVTTGLEKVVFIPIPKERNAKECSDYRAIALISQASKVMLKILQARLQHYMNWVLPDVQAGFRKGRGTRDQIANIHWIVQQRHFRKTSTVSLTWLKPLTVWITTNCGKFFKRWKYQTTLLASWEICIQARKQQLELDREQQTGSKSGKEHVKTVYCHPAYLTYMKSTSCKMPGWMKHKLESRLPEEISVTSDIADNTNLMAESKEELKSLLMKVKEESEKADSTLKKLRSWHPVPSLHGK